MLVKIDRNGYVFGLAGLWINGNGTRRYLNDDNEIVFSYLTKRNYQGKNNIYAYFLNRRERRQKDSFYERYEYLTDAYDEMGDFWGDVDKYRTELDVDEKQIRDIRIVEGYRIEVKMYYEKEFGNIAHDNITLKNVIERLKLFPGEYDRETYEQLKPDYYHVKYNKETYKQLKPDYYHVLSILNIKL